MKVFKIIVWSIKILITILIVNSCNLSKKTYSADKDSTLKVGVVWRADTTSSTFQGVITAIKEVGAVPIVVGPVFSPNIVYDDSVIAEECVDSHGILLQKYADMVKNDLYDNIDIKTQYLNGIDAVVFPGGEDMSPTLFSVPQQWHGIESEIYYDSTRDVSDYLLMQWCLDNDIPTLCICRGMQVLAILSGSSLIQDINMYFTQKGENYGFEHRGEDDDGRCFASHDVIITDSSSLLFDIVKQNHIFNTPSWHHQAVETVDTNCLKVTAVTRTCNTNIIEAIERIDKTFFIGVQYHPEIAVKKHLERANDADKFMSYDEGIAYFKALVKIAKEKNQYKK